VLTTEALISLGEGKEDFEVFGVAEGDGVLAGVEGSDDFKVLLVSFGGVLLLILREFVVVFEHVEDLEALVGFEAVVDFAACWRMGELVMFREAGCGESKWASVGLD
jgi:hypothetical protein